MKQMLKSEKAWEFFRFVVVGVIATLIHYGIYFMLQNYINVNIAYTAGYILSFVANFYLTSYFTFRVKPSWKRLAGLGGAHCINYLMHMGFLNLFLWVGLSKKLAPIPVFAIVVPINFLLVRFVFHQKKDKNISDSVHAEVAKNVGEQRD